VGEGVRVAGPVVHLDEHIGDVTLRQAAVDEAAETVEFGRGRFGHVRGEDQLAVLLTQVAVFEAQEALDAPYTRSKLISLLL
jgi:hypothetical protein